jgi:Leucine-rich repeat (LRR) protein
MRNFGLTKNDIPQILSKLSSNVKIVSLSYNALGDEGICLLFEKLPVNIEELGLVGCEIGDVGGRAIISWLKNAKKLRMLCIEDNNFSPEIRSQIKKVSTHFQLFI